MSKTYPEPVVGCFILNDHDDILLVRSYKWPGKWVVMGGHIELGESIKAAAERETKEEVGLEVQFDRVIETAEFINSPDFHSQKHFIALQCACRVAGKPTPILDNNEIQEARWFPLSQAVTLPDLLERTRDTLRLLLTHPHPLSLP